MKAVMSTVRTGAGIDTTRWAEAPIDARSAAMLNVLATATRATAPYSTQRGNRPRISVERPWSRVRPKRAAISWTAAANGATYTADHTMGSPYAAPTCE